VPGTFRLEAIGGLALSMSVAQFLRALRMMSRALLSNLIGGFVPNKPRCLYSMGNTEFALRFTYVRLTNFPEPASIFARHVSPCGSSSSSFAASKNHFCWCDGL
jgi:hypothetical protein